MHKSKKKTNLAKLYNDLNNDSKKLLMDCFKKEFNLKTGARLYKIIGNPHLLTALEVEFLSLAFTCKQNEILETQIQMQPIGELLAQKRLLAEEGSSHQNEKKDIGSGGNGNKNKTKD